MKGEAGESSKPLLVVNDSDEWLDRFAIVRVTGSKVMSGGSSFAMTVDLIDDDSEADTSIHLILMKNDIARGGSGVATEKDKCLALCESTAKVGDSVGAASGKTYLTSGGSGYKVFSEDLLPYEVTIDGTDCKTFWVTRSAGAAAAGYFVALEDISGNGPFLAEIASVSGTRTGKTVDVHNWRDLLNGASAGYFGQYLTIAGQKDFTQGPCVTPCETNGSISLGSMPDGQEGQAYSHFPSASGVDAGSVSAAGLPAGLSVDTNTGAITGTPTESGDFIVILSASAPEANGNGSCTLTKAAKLKIEPAPPATP